uniref:Ethanolaminephosphotransferase 1 n=1 Tax=Parascaris univalens TaxID=6257 RepID=A0A915CCT7_PARUN
MGLFDAHYLSERQIKGFDTYKYSSVDTSPISNYISHPFWNWLVKFYPLWLAPNVLTLTGFLFVMLGFFIVSFLDYDLDANSNFASPRAIPNWIWLFIAILTFTAHTLDGTDGKQARRTGSSGPIGELFDHGLDSWSTVPFTITIFSIFGRGEFSVSLIRLLCILISVQVIFIVTHWEKYNTGILYLSWGYDASQYGLAGFYLLTYFVEYEFYKFYVFKSVTFAVCFEAGFYVVCIISLIMSIYNMCVSYFVDKTARQENLYEACVPMFSSIVLFAMSLCWAKYSPSNIIDQDPRIFFWTMGTVFSNIACHLIIAQMTQTRADPFNLLVCVYCTVAFVALFGHIGAERELFALRLLAVAITLAHLHYSICLVRQLCNRFNIEAFSLQYLQKNRPQE